MSARLELAFSGQKVAPYLSLLRDWTLVLQAHAPFQTTATDSASASDPDGDSQLQPVSDPPGKAALKELDLLQLSTLSRALLSQVLTRVKADLVQQRQHHG